MIRYALKCAQGHAFESWFQSADAFEKLQSRGHLSCTTCGSSDVGKAIMAPQVSGVSPRDPDPAALARALKKMRTHVEKNSDYVGDKFAQEARAMHLGDAPERAIHGEAKPAEAKALIEDGVPVLPLPFTPKAKVN